MEAAFTLVELMIIVAIIGISASVIIPSILGEKKKQEIRMALTPAQLNDEAIKTADFRKVAEFNGYDVYTFYSRGTIYSMIIPTKDSVYTSVPLEKQEK